MAKNIATVFIPSPPPPKNTQIGIFGMKIKHLATLNSGSLTSPKRDVQFESNFIQRA
jgi:hypothetical protein